MGYYERNGYHTTDVHRNIYHKYAQTFTASATYDLSRVTFPVYRPSGSGTVAVALYSVDALHKPDVMLADLGSIIVTELPNFEYIIVPIDPASPPTLTEGVEYALVLTPSQYNTILWGMDQGNDGFSGYGWFDFNNTGYIAFWDACFACYSYESIPGDKPFTPPTGKPTPIRLVGAANDAIWYEDID